MNKSYVHFQQKYKRTEKQRREEKLFTYLVL